MGPGYDARRHYVDDLGDGRMDGWGEGVTLRVPGGQPLTQAGDAVALGDAPARDEVLGPGVGVGLPTQPDGNAPKPPL